MTFEPINAFYIGNYDAKIKRAISEGFESSGFVNRGIVCPIRILDKIRLEEGKLQFPYLEPFDDEPYVAELLSTDGIFYQGLASAGDYNYSLELTHFHVNDLHLFFGKWIDEDQSQEFLIKCRRVE